MQYKIITTTAVLSQVKAVEKLVQSVNEAISLGWEPVGGVMIGTGIVAQAMIKRR